MKLLSLNTWGGRAGKEKLLSFFKTHKDVDIFCLQEMWAAPYEHLDGHAAGGLAIDHANIMVYGVQEVSALLEHHVPYFHPHHLEHYGLMMLTKNSTAVSDQGDVFVYKERGYKPEGDVGNHARNVQYATFETKKGPRTVMNFHGLWNGKGKGDSDDRLAQSKKILAFARSIPHPFVLCGDFNLLPDTESLKILENGGMRNMIREYGVTSTRTSLYTKPEKFADYIFVSEGIYVRNFAVLGDEVSDHAPLLLEWE